MQDELPQRKYWNSELFTPEEILLAGLQMGSFLLLCLWLMSLVCSSTYPACWPSHSLEVEAFVLDFLTLKKVCNFRLFGSDKCLNI